ncbi:universal stress protein [Desulfonema limicola]|nr:universal stress protein [Desulfonema limicola]
MNYPFIFSPFKIGQYQLKNRLVALPVHTGYAHPDGRVSSFMIEFYSRLADSGVSMVVVANAATASDGVVSRFNLRADKEEFIPGLTRLAKAIKSKGAAACIQLNHAGRFAKTDQPLLPAPVSSSNLAFNISSLKKFMEFFPFEQRFGLTRYFLSKINTWRHSMNEHEKQRVIEDFKKSAVIAFKSGFDMIELHGANGYLLCQFLSPFTNKIKSEDSFQTRISFPLSVIRQVQQSLPENFPVGFRLILQEWVPDGIDLLESLAFASVLEKEKIAYLSASAGTYNSIFSQKTIKKMAKKAYLAENMAKLTNHVKIPTIISGRILTPAIGEKILKNRTAHLIGLGRSLRTDPRWIINGTQDKKIIPCINCNWCIKQVVLDQGFNCSQWPRLYRERTELEHKLLTRNYKSLWVVSSAWDMRAFKNSLALLIPDPGNTKTAISPTILFLKNSLKNDLDDSAQKNFIAWARNELDDLGFSDAPLNIVFKNSQDHEKTLVKEIDKNGYGLIFINSNSNQPWRARMLYKERGKVIALTGANKNYKKIIVPLDLSSASLLVLSFLRQTHMGKKDFDFNFVHVLMQKPGKAEQRWEELKKIAGVDINIPLDFIKSQNSAASALIEKIKKDDYGTVIMGKRGISGIKRWLMGSVSAGVSRSLTDQSLFLID